MGCQHEYIFTNARDRGYRCVKCGHFRRYVNRRSHRRRSAGIAIAIVAVTLAASWYYGILKPTKVGNRTNSRDLRDIIQ